MDYLYARQERMQDGLAARHLPADARRQQADRPDLAVPVISAAG